MKAEGGFRQRGDFDTPSHPPILRTDEVHTSDHSIEPPRARRVPKELPPRPKKAYALATLPTHPTTIRETT
ncbi:hypothetical protein QJS10_CPA16g00739 [Acorus calamus]|uniref:Uncharacterized protein n=1 Tax=Acorus calamus TaxID=4465 RepID=A0AAV9D1X9_ACOCL|nr:hypothetical protein QJS10_CPA16g00739 [Acorus calamus]